MAMPDTSFKREFQMIKIVFFQILNFVFVEALGGPEVGRRWFLGLYTSYDFKIKYPQVCKATLYIVYIDMYCNFTFTYRCNFCFYTLVF